MAIFANKYLKKSKILRMKNQKGRNAKTFKTLCLQIHSLILFFTKLNSDYIMTFTGIQKLNKSCSDVRIVNILKDRNI